MPGYSEEEAKQMFQEWESEFEKPTVPRVMVGFSGVDPDRKQAGGISEARVKELIAESVASGGSIEGRIKEIISEEIGSGTGTATDDEAEEAFDDIFG